MPPVVEQRIGRNLLRCQLIELRLKTLLPLRRIELSDAGIAAHGALRTDADCQACIERLDWDYASAAIVAVEVATVTRITLKSLHAFVEAWEKAGADLSEGSKLMAAMDRHFRDEAPASVTVIAPPDSVENILATVMRKLHRDRHDADGWTYFAAAGLVARREAPDLPKKGLLGLARTTEGFEFAQRPAGSPTAVWMFRPTS